MPATVSSAEDHQNRDVEPGPDDVRLDGPQLIAWRGGGPAVWSPDPGEE
ncbi:hypothetical protein ACIA98_42880 [Streptomyces sp. NPDC051366]